MSYDKNKVDEMILALLSLTSWTEHGHKHAWKSHDWDALDRLHEAGFISNPKSKAKSIVLSEAGAIKSAELFAKHFAKE